MMNITNSQQVGKEIVRLFSEAEKIKNLHAAKLREKLASKGIAGLSTEDLQEMVKVYKMEETALRKGKSLCCAHDMDKINMWWIVRKSPLAFYRLGFLDGLKFITYSRYAMRCYKLTLKLLAINTREQRVLQMFADNPQFLYGGNFEKK